MNSLLGPGSRPWLLDGLVALAFLGAAAAEMAGPSAARGALLVLVPAYTVPLAWRRRAPLLVLCGVLGAVSLVGLVDPAGDYLTPFAAVLLALYSVGAHGGRGTAVFGLGLVLAFFAVGTALDNLREPGSRPVSDLLYMAALNATIWGLARLVHSWRRQARMLQERTAELEQEREWRAQAAVVEERTRIARELHDVIAHSVSLMVVQAAAAEQMLDVNPSRSRAPMHDVQVTGRQAIQELQSLLGILRQASPSRQGSATSDEAELVPQPTLAGLDELAERSRATGIRVQLRVQGEIRPLPLGVELAAYRVVQEALTNVRKHAGATTAEVVLRYDEDQLDIVVEDQGVDRLTATASTAPGHGIVGMRERVAVYGGELRVGQQPEGGFRVHARFPVERAGP